MYFNYNNKRYEGRISEIVGIKFVDVFTMDGIKLIGISFTSSGTVAHINVHHKGTVIEKTIDQSKVIGMTNEEILHFLMEEYNAMIGDYISPP